MAQGGQLTPDPAPVPERRIPAPSQPTRDPLPPLPPTPVRDLGDYPNCRGDSESARGNRAKAAAAYACLVRLQSYRTDFLDVVAARMDSHARSLLALWLQVENNSRYAAEQRQEFYQLINREYRDSLPNGNHLNQHRANRGRLEADYEFVRALYCGIVTSC